MMNIYNGNVTTDGNGYATISLPDYFEALNRNFRFQFTVIDANAADKKGACCCENFFCASRS